MVSAQGFGAMGMTAFYKANDQNSEEDNLATIGKALECGVNFIDTAWIYQNFETGETNEALIGKAIKKYGRDKFVIATKFGIVPSATGLGSDGKPASIRSQLSDSLQRLDIDCIDLYYMHRMDPSTPIEETMKCLLELKNEGKIKYVGLSECTAAELERAHAVMPVSAIQMEWSLQTRDLEDTVVPTARKLGVGIVAYSPLGRGFLSRTFTKKEEMHPGDWRNTQPRFVGDNFDKNVEAGANLEKIAARKGLTAAQVRLRTNAAHARGSCPQPPSSSTRAAPSAPLPHQSTPLGPRPLPSPHPPTPSDTLTHKPPHPRVRSWRWRGCTRAATTCSRSRAPAPPAAWRRTPPPPPSASRPRSARRSRPAPPPPAPATTRA